MKPPTEQTAPFNIPPPSFAVSNHLNGTEPLSKVKLPTQFENLPMVPNGLVTPSTAKGSRAAQTNGKSSPPSVVQLGGRGNFPRGTETQAALTAMEPTVLQPVDTLLPTQMQFLPPTQMIAMPATQLQELPATQVQVQVQTQKQVHRLDAVIEEQTELQTEKTATTLTLQQTVPNTAKTQPQNPTSSKQQTELIVSKVEAVATNKTGTTATAPPQQQPLIPDSEVQFETEAQEEDVEVVQPRPEQKSASRKEDEEGAVNEESQQQGSPDDATQVFEWIPSQLMKYFLIEEANLKTVFTVPEDESTDAAFLRDSVMVSIAETVLDMTDPERLDYTQSFWRSPEGRIWRIMLLKAMRGRSVFADNCPLSPEEEKLENEEFARILATKSSQERIELLTSLEPEEDSLEEEEIDDASLEGYLCADEDEIEERRAICEAGGFLKRSSILGGSAVESSTAVTGSMFTRDTTQAPSQMPHHRYVMASYVEEAHQLFSQHYPQSNAPREEDILNNDGRLTAADGVDALDIPLTLQPPVQRQATDAAEEKIAGGDGVSQLVVEPSMVQKDVSSVQPSLDPVPVQAGPRNISWLSGDWGPKSGTKTAVDTANKKPADAVLPSASNLPSLAVDDNQETPPDLRPRTQAAAGVLNKDSEAVFGGATAEGVPETQASPSNDKDTSKQQQRQQQQRFEDGVPASDDIGSIPDSEMTLAAPVNARPRRGVSTLVAASGKVSAKQGEKSAAAVQMMSQQPSSQAAIDALNLIGMLANDLPATQDGSIGHLPAPLPFLARRSPAVKKAADQQQRQGGAGQDDMEIDEQDKDAPLQHAATKDGADGNRLNRPAAGGVAKPTTRRASLGRTAQRNAAKRVEGLKEVMAPPGSRPELGIMGGKQFPRLVKPPKKRQSTGAGNAAATNAAAPAEKRTPVKKSPVMRNSPIKKKSPARQHQEAESAKVDPVVLERDGAVFPMPSGLIDDAACYEHTQQGGGGPPLLQPPPQATVSKPTPTILVGQQQQIIQHRRELSVVLEDEDRVLPISNDLMVTLLPHPVIQTAPDAAHCPVMEEDEQHPPEDEELPTGRPRRPRRPPPKFADTSQIDDVTVPSPDADKGRETRKRGAQAELNPPPAKRRSTRTSERTEDTSEQAAKPKRKSKAEEVVVPSADSDDEPLCLKFPATGRKNKRSLDLGPAQELKAKQQQQKQQQKQKVEDEKVVAEVVIPKLGCPKCRHAKKGCGRCRAKVAAAVAQLEKQQQKQIKEEAKDALPLSLEMAGPAGGGSTAVKKEKIAPPAKGKQQQKGRPASARGAAAATTPVNDTKTAAPATTATKAAAVNTTTSPGYSKKIFSGLTFLVTGIIDDKGKVWNEEKKLIVTLLQQNGGTVLHEVPEPVQASRRESLGLRGPRHVDFTISNHVMRNEKFLYSAIKGIPILRSLWVKTSVNAGRTSSTRSFILGGFAGAEDRSTFIPVFQNLRVHLWAQDEEFRKAYGALIQHAGATLVPNITENKQPACDVAVYDNRINNEKGKEKEKAAKKRALEKACKAAGIPLRPSDWVTDAFLNGRHDLELPSDDSSSSEEGHEEEEASDTVQEDDNKRNVVVQGKAAGNNGVSQEAEGKEVKVAEPQQQKQHQRQSAQAIKRASAHHTTPANTKAPPLALAAHLKTPQLNWCGSPLADPPAGCLQNKYRQYFNSFTINGVEVPVGSHVELQPNPGEENTRVAEVLALWSEYVGTEQKMFGKFRRFYRPAETSFHRCAADNEVFYSNHIEERVVLAAVIKDCAMAVLGPSMKDVPKEGYFYQFFFDHEAGSLTLCNTRAD